jgi:hypothetical protein
MTRDPRRNSKKKAGRVLVFFVAFIPFLRSGSLGHLIGDRRLAVLFFRSGAAQAGKQGGIAGRFQLSRVTKGDLI